MVRSLSWIDAGDVAAALAKVPRPASTPESPSEPTPSPASPFGLPEVGEGRTVDARLQAFARWMDRHHGRQRWVLADAEGFVLRDGGLGEAVAAETAALVRGRRDPRVAALALNLSCGPEVKALWVETSHGPLTLTLERTDVDGLRAAVAHAFSVSER